MKYAVKDLKTIVMNKSLNLPKDVLENIKAMIQYGECNNFENVIIINNRITPYVDQALAYLSRTESQPKSSEKESISIKDLISDLEDKIRVRSNSCTIGIPVGNLMKLRERGLQDIPRTTGSVCIPIPFDKLFNSNNKTEGNIPIKTQNIRIKKPKYALMRGYGKRVYEMPKDKFEIVNMPEWLDLDLCDFHSILKYLKLSPKTTLSITDDPNFKHLLHEELWSYENLINCTDHIEVINQAQTLVIVGIVTERVLLRINEALADNCKVVFIADQYSLKSVMSLSVLENEVKE